MGYPSQKEAPPGSTIPTPYLHPWEQSLEAFLPCSRWKSQGHSREEEEET